MREVLLTFKGHQVHATDALRPKVGSGTTMSQLSNHWATSSTPQVCILLAGRGVSGLAVTQAGAVRRRTKTFSGSESQWSVVNMCKFRALKSRVTTTARRHNVNA